MHPTWWHTWHLFIQDGLGLSEISLSGLDIIVNMTMRSRGQKSLFDELQQDVDANVRLRYIRI